MMKIIYSDQEYNFKDDLVATVGFFDGLHRGHRFLIGEVIKTAQMEKRLSAVFTFATHPRKVLNSDFQPLLLTTSEEKLELLAETGIDICVVLDFDVKMASLSAYEFLNKVLYSQFRVRTLLVGHDHRFGHNRSEGYFDYKKYGNQLGMTVNQALRFSLPDNTHISSSDIRNLLKNGEIENANLLLGSEYSFSGIVVEGFKNGRKIGFPTANIAVINPEKILPDSGVYAVKVTIADKMYSGMLNIGQRPTLQNGTHTTVEVNIFDFENEIYGSKITVILYAKIRNEQKFSSIDALKNQLQSDMEYAKRILK